ncbi:MAG: sigma-E processing peptidase SpoIIGA [Oscillospiraceae bacterium]|nr:sigma-E processing peptidase SpoIIGA [Oscillospiraceae bacterium]
MVIYIDVLMVTNFLISYFLFMAAAVLSGYTYSRKRIIASSAAGAFFCLYIFVQSRSFAADIIFRLLSLAVSAVTAFGIKDKKKLVLQGACYILLNMLLTGAMALVGLKSTAVYNNNMFFYFSINPVVLVAVSAVIYLLILVFELVKEKVSPQKIYYMDIFFKDFTITGAKAFYDSGFKIKDIISNRDVIVAEFEKVKEYLPRDMQTDIAGFLQGSYNGVKTGFVPVFFTTLSGGGMMPAVKCEHITAQNKSIKNILVAFTENPLGENVSVIFGTDIKKQL